MVVFWGSCLDFSSSRRGGRRHSCKLAQLRRRGQRGRAHRPAIDVRLLRRPAIAPGSDGAARILTGAVGGGWMSVGGTVGGSERSF